MRLIRPLHLRLTVLQQLLPARKADSLGLACLPRSCRRHQFLRPFPLSRRVLRARRHCPLTRRCPSLHTESPLFSRATRWHRRLRLRSHLPPRIHTSRRKSIDPQKRQLISRPRINIPLRKPEFPPSASSSRSCTRRLKVLP